MNTETEKLKLKIMELAKENKELKIKYSNIKEWLYTLIIGYVVEILFILIIITKF